MPVRKRLAVVLMQLDGDGSKPTPAPLTFEDLFCHASSTGLGTFDYYTKVTAGGLDLSGSQVFGWVPALKSIWPALPMSWKEYENLPGGSDPQRFERFHAGIRGAWLSGIDLSPFDCVVVISNHPADSFGYKSWFSPEYGRSFGYALLDQNGWYTGNAAHEVGHALGLDHSWGPPRKYGEPSGEYGDPYDVMSWKASVKRRSSKLNGEIPCALAAANQRLMGWIPANRAITISPIGPVEFDNVFTLAAVGHPEAAGAFVLIVGQFTFEFRRQLDFDSPLPRDFVLVHQERWVDKPLTWELEGVTWIESRAENGGLGEGDTWSIPGTSLDIEVVGFDLAAHQATVRLAASDGSVSLDTGGTETSRVLVGGGTYDWPGGAYENKPGELCAPRSFDYQTFQVTDEVVVTAHRHDIAPSRPLLWRINQQEVVGGSGTVSVPVAYPGPPRTVNAHYELAGDVLKVWNDAADGSWPLVVDCSPAAPVVFEKGQMYVYQFETELKVFAPDYYETIKACADLAKAIISRLRTLPQPVRQGDPLERSLLPIVNPAERVASPSEMVEQLRTAVDTSVRLLPGMSHTSRRRVEGLDGPGESVGRA